MSSSRDQQPPDGPADLPADLLAFAREQRKVADRAEANLLKAAVGWAIMHPAESIEEAETFRLKGFGDTSIPVAGPGAPLVAEFSVAEFAAALGLGTEAGKRYLGQAVELRYRLTRVWARVAAGSLPAWKARRIAEQTLHLSVEAAEHVDRHLAPVAHKVKPAVIDRLIAEAIARYMPDRAEEDRRTAWDQRHLSIDFETVPIAGTATIAGEVDLADAIDLENAVRAETQRLADLGSAETLDQRRATALGNIARRDPTLDYPTPANPAPSKVKPGRQVVLHLHLADTAITGEGGVGGGGVGRVENTRSPVTAQTIRDWCGNPTATVVVKPVIDLADHVHVEAYEVPDRIGEAVALRDQACIFPWCTRPARKLLPDEHAADCDHHTPYAEGGATCTCQLAPLCRRHHRLKTFGGWSTYAFPTAAIGGPAPPDGSSTSPPHTAPLVEEVALATVTKPSERKATLRGFVTGLRPSSTSRPVVEEVAQQPSRNPVTGRRTRCRVS